MICAFLANSETATRAMRTSRKTNLVVWLICAALGVSSTVSAADRPLKTRTVFLIVTDGFRWQEVFTGAEEALMDKTNGGVRDVAALRKQFWRETPETRRQALLPFFWGEIARHGQLY